MFGPHDIDLLENMGCTQLYSSYQMDLHKNENKGQVSLRFKGESQNTYVKENHMLSRKL